tara:strand:- start:204 stop:665 length:462 start_codon:yes stop_codon:yes gene_type:complete
MFKIKTLPVIIFLFLLLSCGYKSTNTVNVIHYSIKEFTITGNKRIGYLIKSEITSESKKNLTRKLKITLDAKTTKEIKEKSISNKILKYKISALVNVVIEDTETKKIIKKNYFKSTDIYSAGNFADTLINERKKINLLSTEIAQEIIYLLKKN